MSTVRKLRRIGGNVNKLGYYLMPPKNWIDTVEKEEGKKILGFTVQDEEHTLVLSPMFENPPVEAPHNSSPEQVMMMLKKGTLISKLREIHKGKHISRIINIPRVWVRDKEQWHKSKVIGLRLTVKPRRIIVVPIYANKKINSTTR
jgi:hypothetical protein